MDPLRHLLPTSKISPWWRKHYKNMTAQLLLWFKVAGRHNLPWQINESNQSRAAYFVWVSEVMLQQTQVATVLKRFNSWMSQFPDIQALADAPIDEVLKQWEGLGYYSRARNIHRTAQQIQNLHHGAFPSLRTDRLALPGIGPSTASAIGSFAFHTHEAIMDANVVRVLSRSMALPVPQTAQDKKIYWTMAQKMTPTLSKDLTAYTQAIMDLGATICTPRNPKCSICPWMTHCKTYLKGPALPSENKPIKTKKQKEDVVLHIPLILNDKQVMAYQPHGNGIWPGLWLLGHEEWVYSPEHYTIQYSGIAKLSHKNIHWHIVVPNHIEHINTHIPVQFLSMLELNQKALPTFLRKWFDSDPPELSTISTIQITDVEPLFITG